MLPDLAQLFDLQGRTAAITLVTRMRAKGAQSAKAWPARVGSSCSWCAYQDRCEAYKAVLAQPVEVGEAPKTGEALAAGFLWLALTLAFDFLFGHFVDGHTWARLLADYDLAAGRVWVLIPLWVGLAPWVFRPRQFAP
jgi:hypothetical protein